MCMCSSIILIVLCMSCSTRVCVERVGGLSSYANPVTFGIKQRKKRFDIPSMLLYH